MLKMLTFYNGEQPLVSLTYYATHPQSYFGQGDVTSEFIGLGRAQHEASRGAGLTVVHFNGAGGNIAAGKYNDGTPETRIVLTDRISDAMQRAWEDTQIKPLTATDVQWRSVPVQLPLAAHLDASTLKATLEDRQASEEERLAAAGKLAYVLRSKAGMPTDLSCLQIGNAYILHMPGELFVEYQLAAQAMKPEATVCMAAYGDYGAAYIGTEVAYWQGGYETQPSSSNVAPQVEQVLLDGVRKLLQ